MRQLLARAEYLGCTGLGRPKAEIMEMTTGELLTQLALHAHYTNGTQLAGQIDLLDLFG